MHLECGFGVGDIGHDPSDVSQGPTLVPRNIWYIDTLSTITEIQPGRRVIPYPLLFNNLSLQVYCGRDKGMPNGWSFNWESMATKERENLETRCVDSLLVLYVLRRRLNSE